MKSSGDAWSGAEPPRIERTVRAARWREGCWWWCVCVIGLGGAVLLWWQKPAGQIYYPRCAMYVMTGLKCPGCGVMRATHFLLRGELGMAWRMNALWVCLMPLWVWSGLAMTVGRRGWRVWNPLSWPWVWGGVAGLACVYGILRNFPGWGGWEGW